jgi:hypothetical protein
MLANANQLAIALASAVTGAKVKTASQVAMRITFLHQSCACSFRNLMMASLPRLTSKRSTSISTLRGAKRLSASILRSSATTCVGDHSLAPRVAFGIAVARSIDGHLLLLESDRSPYTPDVVCHNPLAHICFSQPLDLCSLFVLVLL